MSGVDELAAEKSRARESASARMQLEHTEAVSRLSRQTAKHASLVAALKAHGATSDAQTARAEEELSVAAADATGTRLRHELLAANLSLLRADEAALNDKCAGDGAGP